MIWYDKQTTLDSLASMGKGTMTEHLGITFSELGDDYLKATMPVDHRTIQPYGLLHGGASCVLAETIGSVASALVINQQTHICVGIEINANHLRGVTKGLVTGTTTPIHIGKSTHVWDIRIVDDNDKLICISRLTVAILPRTDQR